MNRAANFHGIGLLRNYVELVNPLNPNGIGFVTELTTWPLRASRRYLGRSSSTAAALLSIGPKKLRVLMTAFPSIRKGDRARSEFTLSLDVLPLASAFMS